MSTIVAFPKPSLPPALSSPLLKPWTDRCTPAQLRQLADLVVRGVAEGHPIQRMASEARQLAAGASAFPTAPDGRLERSKRARRSAEAFVRTAVALAQQQRQAVLA
jgi:hypothetical protein